MRELIGVVRAQDVLDILLVTTLVYTAVVWIRRTQAAFVAIGLFLLGGLYVAAQALDLRLTTWLFHSFFAILVVVVVVIFQEEIRQLFERLAVWTMRRRAVPDGHSVPADILVHALTDLARQHVGALVVLPGQQPIDRYVRGGLELGGRLSVPLLLSLFDPHSPGHDGAVIVQGDRVLRFAAHLPLSNDFAQLAGVGTRHSAALGLAELSDALSLIVSEERGQVSAARDGRLLRLKDPGELTAVITGFLQATQPPERRTAFWRQLLLEHWVEKVASLAIVALLWGALVPGSRPVERTYEVPVRVTNLPGDLALDEVRPSAVNVTFAGPWREFYLFNPRYLEVTIDASLAGAGRRTFHILEHDVRFPKELRLQEISPGSVRLALRAPEPEAPAEPAEPAPEQAPAPPPPAEG
jgi:diadenylate cyclase